MGCSEKLQGPVTLKEFKDELKKIEEDYGEKLDDLPIFASLAVKFNICGRDLSYRTDFGIAKICVLAGKNKEVVLHLSGSVAIGEPKFDAGLKEGSQPEDDSKSALKKELDDTTKSPC